MRIESWQNKLDLTLFYGPDPQTSIEKMTASVGRPALPPPFAFAPWLDAIYGSQNVRDVAKALRDSDVPSSVIWTEDWRGGKVDGVGYTLDEDWEVDRSLYPDFEQVASDLHDEGYKFLTYNNTFLDSQVPVYQEAVKGGYTIKDDKGQPFLFTGVKFHDTSMADLSSPDAVAWVKKKYKDGLDLGADGYMADYGEWLPTDAKLASGESAVERHNLYPVDFQRLNKELFDSMHKADGVDRLYFVRSAYLGSQPLVSVIWAGDQQTDFSEGDGLPSVVPMGIGLGVTGFPYFGSDIAGYMSQGTQPSTKELFFRWTELGAFSPVMRTHHGKSAAANWNWQKDAGTIDHFKRYAKLHIQLFPYLYELAKQASETGAPIMRPLAYDYPDFTPGWSMTDEYMLGDRLIVAPVETAGATKRDVQLPGGTLLSAARRKAREHPRRRRQDDRRRAARRDPRLRAGRLRAGAAAGQRRHAGRRQARRRHRHALRREGRPRAVALPRRQQRLCRSRRPLLHLERRPAHGRARQRHVERPGRPRHERQRQRDRPRQARPRRRQGHARREGRRG